MGAHPIRAIALAVTGLIAAAPAWAADLSVGHGSSRHEGEQVETEDIFGFTEGTVFGEAGESELELDTTGSFGAAPGGPSPSYQAVSLEAELNHNLTDDLKLGAAGLFSYHHVRDTADLDDLTRAAPDGVSGEVKVRLLELGPSPIGLAIVLEPEWRRLDERSGTRTRSYSLGTTVEADTALVAGRLYAAVNLGIEPEWSKEAGEPWDQGNELSVSAALSARVYGDVFLGGEVRSLTTFENGLFDQLAGRALFVGPSAYWKVSEHAFLKGAVSFQVAGRSDETPSRALDLDTHERQEARVELGIDF